MISWQNQIAMHHYLNPKLCFLLVFLFTVTALMQAQVGGIAAPSEPRFRVVKAISGSRGSQQGGRYIVEDPRSTFYIPADKHVVVYFDWEGPVGKHHFEAFWKNPDGKTVVISDFSYEAKERRFAGYWQLDLNDSMPVGTWSVEARIDGEFAGLQSFQVVAAEKPANAEPTRHLLEPAEIYRRALKISVFVDKFAAKGEKKGTGSGFFIGDNLIVTAFQVIDGASNIRVRLPNGTNTETSQVIKWNRLQDWAILRVPQTAPAKLDRAAAGSWAVGDRCFSLDVQAGESRIIIDESITGTNSFPIVGDRLNLSYSPAGAAIGAPVLNEYGEIIGVFGGSIYPGMPSRSEPFNPTMSALPQSAMATPITLVGSPAPNEESLSLEELARHGEFVPPLVEQPELLYGILSSHFDLKKGEVPSSRETKGELSLKEGNCAVLLAWNPKAKARGQVTLRIFDVYNHAVMGSKPSPIQLRPGIYLTNSWNLPINKLQLGMYRIDVLQDENTVWRSYFRLVE